MGAIDARMTRARSQLVLSQPFFGTLAMHLEIVDAQAAGETDIDTMATDGKKLWFFPPWLDTITEAEILGVIAHEVLHCAYRHQTRRQNRDATIWNQAADYAINRDLLIAGFKLPACGLFDKEGRFKDMNAEAIYEILKREDDAKPKDQRKAGSGPGEFGGKGGVRDAAPASEPAEIAKQDREWEVRVRQALNVAAAGKSPAGLQQLVKGLAKSVVDWRDLLRRFIDNTIQTDYSWMRPNKRMLHSGFVLPSLVTDGISKVGVVFDTSGSTRAMMKQFIAEIRAAMDDGAIQTLITISCDTMVYNPQEFQAGDDLKNIQLKGGGGTRFAPALEWFEEHHPDCTALIYFTDLECNDFGREPACPLLWAACGEYRPPLPFGELIDLVPIH